MKTLISLCIVWMLACPIVSGQVLTIDQIKTEPVTVNTGITFKLHSKEMNEDRIVMISVPDGYATSTKKYPVLYLMDGQWGFSSTAQTLGWLSNERYGMIPQTIVVSLHTGENRPRDLAPTMDKWSNAGGGADKLYAFIAKELIPFVDKNYRTYNYKVIGGASLGGLFVMYAFVSNPQLFNGYLSMSPAMWWDNKTMLDKTKECLLKNPDLNCRIYLALANEGVGMGVDSLASIIEKHGSKKLIWKYDKQVGEVHETVTYKATWDGMKFLLADWQYPMIDFGTKERIFSSQDSVAMNKVNHKIVKLSDKSLDNCTGLYLDSYKRILAFTKGDKEIILSGSQLPTIALYPEAENKFFIKDVNVQNELFLKGFDVQFEFVKNDSLVVTANGKVDCTAKKIKCSPLVKLSDEILKKYLGTYLELDEKNKFEITKEGNILKFEGDMLTTYLYPIGETKFFAFFDGQGFEAEFISDGAKNVTKMSVTQDGKTVFEVNKIK